MSIDYRNGKVVWDNSDDWGRDDYAYQQDILQLLYGDNLIIDVGHYGQSFVIMVVDQAGVDDPLEAWRFPYATIPCRDKQDLLTQLQRAIDLYPGMLSPSSLIGETN